MITYIFYNVKRIGVNMLNLVRNELIKIFKRKNIYVLFLVVILIIMGYNMFERYSNNIKNIDISEQYTRAYNQDKMYLENYENLNLDESYSDILERVNLEKYAIENNIQYNILLNTENKNAILPSDARILLMKFFNNFDIIIIFIIIYLASTIIYEEYSNGTIKNLLVKPHKRSSILFSKVTTTILVTLFITIAIILFQYVIGGIIFGFDSYSLDAIRYNHITQNIEVMNLGYYMLLIFAAKIPMYLLVILISLLLSVFINNIGINILISLGLYMVANLETLFNNITKYLFMYNWDISKYIFGNVEIINNKISSPIIISSVWIILITTVLFIGFNKKDIVNE